LIEPNLNEGDKRHILVTHDESVFYANDSKKHSGDLAGLSLHISDFLTEVDSRLKFEQDEACITIKPDVNRNSWWKAEDLITQVIIPIFEKLHPGKIGIFAFDNVISYAAYLKDALIASKINL
ncbi:hypothetical protein C1646_606786, partial [Rhizophagus diaphanus]